MKVVFFCLFQMSIVEILMRTLYLIHKGSLFSFCLLKLTASLGVAVLICKFRHWNLADKRPTSYYDWCVLLRVISLSALLRVIWKVEWEKYTSVYWRKCFMRMSKKESQSDNRPLKMSVLNIKVKLNMLVRITENIMIIILHLKDKHKFYILLRR